MFCKRIISYYRIIKLKILRSLFCVYIITIFIWNILNKNFRPLAVDMR